MTQHGQAFSALKRHFEQAFGYLWPPQRLFCWTHPCFYAICNGKKLMFGHNTKLFGQILFERTLGNIPWLARQPISALLLIFIGGNIRNCTQLIFSFPSHLSRSYSSSMGPWPPAATSSTVWSHSASLRATSCGSREQSTILNIMISGQGLKVLRSYSNRNLLQNVARF